MALLPPDLQGKRTTCIFARLGAVGSKRRTLTRYATHKAPPRQGEKLVDGVGELHYAGILYKIQAACLDFPVLAGRRPPFRSAFVDKSNHIFGYQMRLIFVFVISGSVD
jgi:hypothetical protein